MAFIGKFTDWQSFFAFIASILFSSCPIFTMVSLHKQYRSHKEVSFCTYLCMFLNSAIWFDRSLFLILNNDGKIQEVHPMDYSNLIGTCLCYIWCVILIHYKYKSNSIKKAGVLIIFTILMLICAIIEAFLTKDESSIIDIFFKVLGSIVNVLMYISPGLNVIFMFGAPRPELIRIENSFFGCINSLLWLLWGVDSNQIHTAIANSIGLPLCIIQVVYYLVCYLKMGKNGVPNKIIPILDEDNKRKDNVNEEEGVEKKEKVEKTEAEKLEENIDNYI